MQSTFSSVSQGIHVAIIMDGNGRWAVAQDLRGRPGTARARTRFAASSRPRRISASAP